MFIHFRDIVHAPPVAPTFMDTSGEYYDYCHAAVVMTYLDGH